MVDPFSAATGALGVISTGIQVCSGLLKYYMSVKDSRKDVAAMYRSLDGLAKTFLMIQQKLDSVNSRLAGPDADAVLESIQSCTEDIDTMRKKLAKFPSTTPKDLSERLKMSAHRLQYPLKEKILIKMMSAISDLRGNLNVAASFLHINVSTSALQKMDTLEQYLLSNDSKLTHGLSQILLGQEEQRDQFQKCIQDAKGRADRQNKDTIETWLTGLTPSTLTERHNASLNRKREGTGSWLFESGEMKQWLTSKINTLWCPGMPGSGKTVSMSIVIQHLQRIAESQTLAIAYVYCAYDQQGQTATNLMANLLAQIVHQTEAVTQDLVQFWKTYRTSPARPTLVEYVRIIKSQIDQFPRAFFLVDALDELTEKDNAREVFVAQLQTLLPDIQLLITSRELPCIRKMLGAATRLEIRAHDEDIRTALTGRIEEEPLLRSHIGDDPSLKDRILETIIRKTNGMFLLAELHITSLAKEDNKRDLRQALGSLPTELNGTYRQTMARIESQDKHRVKRAHQVITWILHARRALSIEELQCALAIKTGDTNFDKDGLVSIDVLLSTCHGLVVVDRQSGLLNQPPGREATPKVLNVVRFVHYTTEEFFEQIRTTTYPFGHELLAKVCITFLSFTDFSCDSFFAERTYKNLHTNSRELETLKERYPLLAYSARNWGNHAQLALNAELGASQKDVFLSDKEKLLTHRVMAFLAEKRNVFLSVRAMQYTDRSYGSDGPRGTVSDLHLLAHFKLGVLAGTIIPSREDIDARDPNGRTPLSVASASGDQKMVKKLLKLGSNVDSKDRNGCSAIMLADQAGHSEIVEMLARAGPQETLGPPYENCPCPTLSLRRRKVADIVTTIMDRSHNPKEMEDQLRSVARKSALSGRVEVFPELLEIATDLRAFHAIVRDAFVSATSKNRTALMEFLIDQGADVNESTGHGQLPLHYSAEYGGGVEGMRILLDRGASIDARDSRGRTALHIAAGYRSTTAIDCVECLLERGACVDVHDLKGKTPLIHAVGKKSYEIVRLLLTKNASQSVEDTAGCTAVQARLRKGPAMVGPLLGSENLEEERDPTLQITQLSGFVQIKESCGDRNSNDTPSVSGTALHYAARVYGRDAPSIATLLLEYGAEIESTDGAGETPLCIAVRSGNLEMVQFFLDQGTDLCSVWTAEGVACARYHRVYEEDFERAMRLVREKKKTLTSVLEGCKVEGSEQE